MTFKYFISSSFITFVMFIALLALLGLSARHISASAGDVFTYRVLNSSDDARNIRGSSRGDFTAATHYIGNKGGTKYVHGLRFANVTLPQGSKIKSAKLEVYSAGDVGTAMPRIKVSGDLSENAATFRLMSDTPENRKTTTATTEYAPERSLWSKQGFTDSIDVTAVVEEIVNQPGWQNGNSIALIESSDAPENSYVSYSTYDRDIERAPKLVIEVEGSTLSGLMDLYKRLQTLVNLYKLERSVTLSPMNQKALTMAWIYPGEPACGAMSELDSGARASFLKPEYFSLDETGSLQFLTVDVAGCNGYSKANIDAVKASADHAYVTVAGGEEAVRAFFSKNWDTQSSALNQLTQFVIENDIEGVEIDFEGYGGWTDQTYRGYMGFLNELGKELHGAGKKLMVDVPPISNPTEQSYYKLRYEDISALPIDFIVVMAYDYQYDHGAGNAIAPNSWVIETVKNAKRFIETDRLVIGIPAYGYSGRVNSYDMQVTSSAVIRKKIDASRAERDLYSYELIAKQNGQAYVFQDAQSLDKKRKLVESLGVKYISVWALGGGVWFSE